MAGRTGEHAIQAGPIIIVGKGRLGSALARALSDAGATVIGPLGRDATSRFADGATVLLCVPDREVMRVAAAMTPGPIVGHCSGSLTLEAIAPHEGFSLHPLMTVTDSEATFEGASAAIAGTTVRAMQRAREIARLVGLETIQVAEADRAVYHAAASMASNFIVTLATAAERLGALAGLERRHLIPLAHAAIENWAKGGAAALTGPLIRGDEETTERQRQAVERTSPDLLPVWDALSDATRGLAREGNDQRRTPIAPRHP